MLQQTFYKPNEKLQPTKLDSYTTSNVYFVFNTSVKYGMDKLTYKGQVTAYNDEDAAKFAKQQFGKRAIAIFISNVDIEKYFPKGRPKFKTRKKNRK